MEIHLLGYLLAGLVGVSLGLLGSGGSILTVPILVYVMALSPLTATAYSLFIVGVTAWAGTVRNVIMNRIAYREVLVFGIPSLTAVFLTRLVLLPSIPAVISIENYSIGKDILIMVLFAIVMISAAYSMLRMTDEETPRSVRAAYPYLMIVLWAIAVGVVAGLVGAGGGFLIVPSLMALANMPVKRAIATSLMIVSIQSLLGFSGDLLVAGDVDWPLILKFSGCSIVGMFIGLALAKRIHSENLKRLFGYFVLMMGVYIIIRELIL